MQEKSLNVSVEKSLKESYGASGLIKKNNFSSPRAVTAQDKSNVYSSLSNRKNKVSASLAFNAGALKEKSTNTNVVERLSNHNRKFSGIKLV